MAAPVSAPARILAGLLLLSIAFTACEASTALVAGTPTQLDLLAFDDSADLIFSVNSTQATDPDIFIELVLDLTAFDAAVNSTVNMVTAAELGGALVSMVVSNEHRHARRLLCNPEEDDTGNFRTSLYASANVTVTVTVHIRQRRLEENVDNHAVLSENTPVHYWAFTVNDNLTAPLKFVIESADAGVGALWVTYLNCPTFQQTTTVFQAGGQDPAAAGDTGAVDFAFLTFNQSAVMEITKARPALRRGVWYAAVVMTNRDDVNNTGLNKTVTIRAEYDEDFSSFQVTSGVTILAGLVSAILCPIWFAVVNRCAVRRSDIFFVTYRGTSRRDRATADDFAWRPMTDPPPATSATEVSENQETTSSSSTDSSSLPNASSSSDSPPPSSSSSRGGQAGGSATPAHDTGSPAKDASSDGSNSDVFPAASASTDEMSVPSEVARRIAPGAAGADGEPAATPGGLYYRGVAKVGMEFFSFPIVTATIVAFFGVPSFQWAISQLRLMGASGDRDICFYNEKCLSPSTGGLGMLDGTSLVSNYFYIVFGIANTVFLTLYSLYDRYQLSTIPFVRDATVLIAMSIALVGEGLLSLTYHICPSVLVFQADSAFMFVITVLIAAEMFRKMTLHRPTLTSVFFVMALLIVVQYCATVFDLNPPENSDRLSLAAIQWNFATGVIVAQFLAFVMAYISVFGTDVQDLVFGVGLGSVVAAASVFVWNSQLPHLAQGVLMGTLTAVFLSCFLFALRLSWIESCACCQRPKVPSTRDPRAYTRGGMIAMGCTVAGIAVAGVIGVYFFIIKSSTDKTSLPWDSRDGNNECEVAHFDYHDLWHILSGCALGWTIILLAFTRDPPRAVEVVSESSFEILHLPKLNDARRRFVWALTGALIQASCFFSYLHFARIWPELALPILFAPVVFVTVAQFVLVALANSQNKGLWGIAALQGVGALTAFLTVMIVSSSLLLDYVIAAYLPFMVSVLCAWYLFEFEVSYSADHTPAPQADGEDNIGAGANSYIDNYIQNVMGSEAAAPGTDAAATGTDAAGSGGSGSGDGGEPTAARPWYSRTAVMLAVIAGGYVVAVVVGMVIVTYAPGGFGFIPISASVVSAVLTTSAMKRHSET